MSCLLKDSHWAHPTPMTNLQKGTNTRDGHDLGAIFEGKLTHIGIQSKQVESVKESPIQLNWAKLDYCFLPYNR